jgi:hypothetical protein
MIPNLLAVYERINPYLGYRYDALIGQSVRGLLEVLLGELQGTRVSLEGARAFEAALEEFDAFESKLPDIPGLRHCGALILAHRRGIHAHAKPNHGTRASVTGTTSVTLFETLAAAVLVQGNSEQLAVWSATVGNDTCKALYLQPPARVVFTVPEGGRGIFSFGVTIHPEAWERSGDGCTFSIAVDGRVALSVDSDPVHRYEDRQWWHYTLTIPESRSGKHEIILATQGRGGSADYRWALWRNLRFTSAASQAYPIHERTDSATV